MTHTDAFYDHIPKIYIFCISNLCNVFLLCCVPGPNKFSPEFDQISENNDIFNFEIQKNMKTPKEGVFVLSVISGP